MRPFVLLLLIVLLGSFIHKDRLSPVIRVEFQFLDGQIVKVKSQDTLMLRKVSASIISKRNLKNARVIFSTGEQAIFVGNGKQWQSIAIYFRSDSLNVPTAIVKKITEVYFDDINLLWSGSKETSFGSSYLNLVFATGGQTQFGVFPKMQLLCWERKRWDPTIVKAISKNSTRAFRL